VAEPGRDDIFEYGTIAEVLQTINMPDGTVRIRVLGRSRAKLVDLSVEAGTLFGDIQAVEPISQPDQEAAHFEAMRRMIIRKFDDYVRKVGRIPLDVLSTVNQMTSLEKLADTVSDALIISIEEKQDLIEMFDLPKRLARIVEILDSEIEILNIERKIQTRVHRQIEKNQKEYYLNEQVNNGNRLLLDGK
jgi:ATP-dependent Lon protease